MPTIAELEKTKEKIKEEMKKPPHERDGRMFQHHTAAERLQMIDEKIQNKKQKQKQWERKRETRRKILMGAAFKQALEEQEITLKEYLEEYDDHNWGEEIQQIDRGGKQRLIVLGALILRDMAPYEFGPYLESMLEPTSEDWRLFPEVQPPI